MGKHTKLLLLKWLPCLTLLTTMPLSSVMAADGDGDVDDDDDGLIEIYSLAQLDQIRHDLAGTSLASDTTGCPAEGCTGYELANDLNFDTNNDGVMDSADTYWQASKGWSPIGTTPEPFTATFNGNGYAIHNLYIDREDEDYVGLFGVTNNANLQNLSLDGELMQIIGRNTVGALTGRANSTNIFMIAVNGYIEGANVVGALAGSVQDNSTIGMSNTSGSVSALELIAGGMVGSLYLSTVSESHSSAEVIGRESIAGMVGQAVEATIKKSFASGDVNGSQYVGGLTATMEASAIDRSYATGDVYGNGDSVGGLSGRVFSTGGYGGTSITNSYAWGHVTGNNSVGGLVGETINTGDSTSISYSYASGQVTGNSLVGGLLGSSVDDNGGTLSIASFWDETTSGQSTSVIGTGLTTTQLTCPESGLSSGCKSLFSGWNEAIWDFGNSEQYPALIIDSITHRDSDGDGVFDELDAFPSDSSRSVASRASSPIASSSSSGGSPSIFLSALLILIGSLRRRTCS